MVNQSFEPTAEGRRRLDAYLDEIEQRLAGQGMERSERRSVVDDIEAQATEVLRARTSNPGLDTVEQVLATLDAPDAYGPGAESAGPADHLTAPPAQVAVPNANWGVPKIVKVVGAVVLGLGLLGTIFAVTILLLMAAPAG
ncbi:MAG: hypothetical protein QGI10_00680 [Vicinamibacterales bacterium]|jgi:hypothetical protein|nr:hypothetical protein [Vicinamibacterales bacterium]MDP7477761.1 hypothetical protein [Vicinamibacterales bacterium]HJN42867.1 hypothetical protein [Vicinamibacterales bacterium]